MLGRPHVKPSIRMDCRDPLADWSWSCPLLFMEILEVKKDEITMDPRARYNYGMKAWLREQRELRLWDEEKVNQRRKLLWELRRKQQGMK